MANVTKRYNKDGEPSYLIRAFVTWGADGKQITKSMTWKPPAGMKPSAADKQAKKEAALFDEKIKDGAVTVGGSVKFAEYAARWLEDSSIRPNTVLSYKKLLVRINQAMGHIPLDKITAEHIKRFIRNLREDGVNENATCIASEKFFEWFANLDIKVPGDVPQKTMRRRTPKKYKINNVPDFAKILGMSRNTIYTILDGKEIKIDTAKKICSASKVDFSELFIPCEGKGKLSDVVINSHFVLLKTILKNAKDERVIPYNVAEYVKAPKYETKEAKYLDDEQARAFLNALISEPEIKYVTPLSVLLFTGLRRGELCGLTWGDIDMYNGMIYVRRQTQWFKGMGAVDVETKTKSSVRSIKVPPQVIFILSTYEKWCRECKEACGDVWDRDNSKVFISEDGGLISPDAMGKWLKKILRKNDLPLISLHGLRHTFITLQIAAGVDVRTLQSRTGHTKASTLLDVYSHAVQSAQDKAAALLGDMLTPKNEAISTEIPEPALIDLLHKN